MPAVLFGLLALLLILRVPLAFSLGIATVVPITCGVPGSSSAWSAPPW